MLSHPSQEIHLHNTNTYKLAYNFISKFFFKKKRHPSKEIQMD